MNKKIPSVDAFTASQLNEIAKMRSQGKSIKDIAKALHKGDKTIAAVIKRGLPPPDSAPAKECDFKDHPAVKLRAQGLSIKAIAKKLHISDKTVSAIVKKTSIGAPEKSSEKPFPKNGIRVIEFVKIPIPKAIAKMMLAVIDHHKKVAKSVANGKPTAKKVKKPSKKAK